MIDVGRRGGAEMDTARLVLSLFSAFDNPAKDSDVSAEIPSRVVDTFAVEAANRVASASGVRVMGSETVRGAIVRRGIEEGGSPEICSLPPDGFSILLVVELEE